MSNVSRRVSDPKIRLAYVTNGPAPYRVPMWTQLARERQLELKVFFATEREPDRHWDLGTMDFPHEYLREFCIPWRGRFIHTNPDVWQRLNAFKPDVVLTTGFNPTHLMAFAHARAHGLRHVAMTDGTLQSEARLGTAHRVLRRHVYARTAAFAGPCEGSFDLFRSYGIGDAHLFKSHLVADNEAFVPARSLAKRFDFIVCGRLSAVKNPLFALDVGAAVARRLGRKVSLSFVGSGEMEPEIRRHAESLSDRVDTHFAGFASQADLPQRYGEARVFLFPTLWDPWGVVANEASAAGLPTLVSPHAGSARELIRHGHNGYVLDLELDAWADAASRLLSNDALWQSMSSRATQVVEEYTSVNAAQGIAAAARHAAGLPQPGWNPMILPAARRPAAMGGMVQRDRRRRLATSSVGRLAGSV